MSKVTEYKCPACGGAMEFDSATQKMKCPYCDTEIEIATFEEESLENAAPTDNMDAGEWHAEGGSQWQEGETDGLKIYVCESCGGEIVADENMGATSCPFCGNQIVIKGQFGGDLRPDYIVPFKLDKKAAKEAYYKHLSGKKFLPRIFKKENHIDEMKGVYVPFWIFDAMTDSDIHYSAQRVRTWRSGKKEYTETQYYNVHRAGQISYEHVPTDCSKKMDDVLMESIEPFDFKDAVPFKAAYLAGYLADRYDVEKEECVQRASERIKKSVQDSFENTVKGYTSVVPVNKNINVGDVKYHYTLYPVWLLNTTWKNQKYTFAMNGQTGKLVGDLPADQGAFWKYVAKWGVLFSAVIYAVMWIFTLI